MALAFLTDLELPTVRRRVTAETVADYVGVTGDDPERWRDTAPPSYAGALLFAAAPELLDHRDVMPYTTVLVHLDQTFRWEAPLPFDTQVDLRGAVTRVRERSGAQFVTYGLDIVAGGAVVITSRSTFLLGAEAAGGMPSERTEPSVRMRTESDEPDRYDITDGIPTLTKSASRHDLVRYAAASGDFNPIHFDHEAARKAGLAGIVCHGLLTTAWVTQLVAGATSHPVPIAELSVRYRDPVFPGDPVFVTGTAAERADSAHRIDLAVTTGERTAITGRAMIREG